MNEGNLISFKVFVDAKGNLMTEYSKLPSCKRTFTTTRHCAVVSTELATQASSLELQACT